MHTVQSLPIPAASQECLNPFVVVTLILGGAGALLALVAAAIAPQMMFLVAAVLCGWSELRGHCGLAHVGTITSLRDADSSKRLWLKAVASYTLAGVLTSGIVGLAIGAVGSLVERSTFSDMIPVVAVIAIPVLVSHSLGLLRFQLPQVKRQTNKFWAFEFGVVPASAMWGAHIGLGFATVIAHGGIFAIALVAADAGPAFGILVFGSFWLGRTLPLWIMPMVLNNGRDISWKAFQAQAYYGYIAAVGLAVTLVGLFVG